MALKKVLSNNLILLYILLTCLLSITENCDDKGEIPFLPKLNEPPEAKFYVEKDREGTLRYNFYGELDPNGEVLTYDPDGEIVKYEWDFGDLACMEGKNPFHTYEYEGIYIVKLTVTDDDDEESTAFQEVEVFSVNKPPHARLVITDDGKGKWTFDGSESYDEDGFISTYKFKIVRLEDDKIIKEWPEDKINKRMYVFRRTDFIEDEPYTIFLISLVVKDDKGAKGEDIGVLKLEKI